MDNLEEIFYSEDGTFHPLTDKIQGNTNGELAHARNTFMEAERERFLELLKDKKTLDRFLDLLTLDSESLLLEAQKLQDKLEYGEIETREEQEMMKSMTPEERDQFHMDNLTRVEGLIILLSAAARDKVKMLELIKTMDLSEEEHMSMRR